jgi:ParB-like chromosome segregation protein Spo0J
MRSAGAALGTHIHRVFDAPDEERPMEIASLGERLSALRLCDAAALRAVEHSLVRHGQLSPIGVFVEAPERLEVLDGFKRVRAARALGWSSVQGRVLPGAGAVDAKRLLVALHEQRGLTEIEEAWLVRSLYRDDDLSQPEIARLLSRHKSWVCRRLALVESLDSEVAAEVRLGLLAPRAAVAVAALPRGNQRAASAVVIRHGMTVRQTEHFVHELSERPEAARAALIAVRLEAGPCTSGRPGPRALDKTHAERMTQDIETLRAVAARLQTSLLATALDTLGPPAAELVRASLARLLPVLGALGVTAAQAVGEDRAA